MQVEDIVVMMQQEATQFYYSDIFDSKSNGINMLVIIQDLDLNGANVVLVELLRLLKEKNCCNYYIISPSDGEYREKFLEIGANIAIRQNVNCNSEYRLFLQNAFDLVFMNTSSVHYYSTFFVNCKTKVIWWFHESEEQLSSSQGVSVHPFLLGDNFYLCGVTQKVLNGLKKLYGVDAEFLPMAVKDCRQNYPAINSDMVEFLIPSAYTYIKGQDILLQAIAMLPEEYRNKTRFTFVGYHLSKQDAFFNACKKLAGELSCVSFLDAMDREKVYEMYSKCDCIIAPSRVDSTPTSIVEAMMFGKICLVSSNAGISDYLTDCVNGFVFESENIEELFKRLILIISDKSGLDEVAERGRKRYEEIFECEAVLNRFQKILAKMEIKL